MYTLTATLFINEDFVLFWRVTFYVLRSTLHKWARSKKDLQSNTNTLTQTHPRASINCKFALCVCINRALKWVFHCDSCCSFSSYCYCCYLLRFDSSALSFRRENERLTKSISCLPFVLFHFVLHCFVSFTVFNFNTFYWLNMQLSSRTTTTNNNTKWTWTQSTYQAQSLRSVRGINWEARRDTQTNTLTQRQAEVWAAYTQLQVYRQTLNQNMFVYPQYIYCSF